MDGTSGKSYGIVKERNMNTKVETKSREAILVEDAAQIHVMGFPVLEALPSRSVSYEQVECTRWLVEES